MRKLKNTVKITHPYAVFIEPGDVDEDGKLQWLAKVVGHDLDNITWDNDPLKALASAVDMLGMLMGRCTLEVPEHEWDEDSFLETLDGTDGVEAWRCSRCNERAAKTEFDDYGVASEEHADN